MQRVLVVFGLLWLVLFSACGLIDEINIPLGTNPESADVLCQSLTRDDDGEFVRLDPLACDCLAIDGRDPKCWGYTEYKDRPLPLPDPLSAQTPGPKVFEPSQADQADGPEIPLNGVVNAASFMNRILNAGPIARGSIFSIFGSRIGPAIGVAVTSFPLGTELGGVRVRVFTLDGAVEAIPLFVSSGQINAIMPSDAPLGFVAVEVIFEGRMSNVAPAQIVEASGGIFTSIGSGNGPGSVTNFISQTEQPLNTPANPTSPGEFITLWVTGLGAVAGPDSMRPIDIGAVVDVRDRIQLEIFIGSQRVTNIFYAGRSAEFSGLDQIVFQIPADAELGCFTPINIRINGRPSNGATLAVSAKGQPCPLVANTLTVPPITQGVFASVSLTRLAGSDRDALDAAFEAFAVEQASSVFVTDPPPPSGFSIFTNLPPAGSCVSSGGLEADGELDGSIAGLESNVDAGAEITLTRADGAQRVISLTEGGLLGGSTPGGNPTPLFLEAGQYRLESDGGAQVGAIGVDLIVPRRVVWTNRDSLARVSRSGFEVRWQDGSPGQTVAVLGYSSNGVERVEASFSCTAVAGAGSLFVPDFVLANLPNGRIAEDGILMLFVADELAPLNAPGVGVGSISLTSLEYRTLFYRD